MYAAFVRSRGARRPTVIGSPRRKGPAGNDSSEEKAILGPQEEAEIPRKVCDSKILFLSFESAVWRNEELINCRTRWGMMTGSFRFGRREACGV